MDPLTLAMGLATVVPDVLKWLGHDNAAQSAEKIVNIAQKVTGASSGEDALAAVKDNPTLALQMQQELDRNKEELAKLSQAVALAEVEQVNATMRAEAASEHWPSYSWRPTIGFAFALNLVLAALMVAGVFIGQVFGLAGAPAAIAALPQALGSLAAINGVAAPVLGIASYFRGKMQADPSIPTINRG